MASIACFHPLYGWQREDGQGPLLFGAERAGYRKVDIPCGYCVGCRLARSRAWALRCMHEAQLHEFNSFVTLTYSDEFYSPSLNYSDFQLFMRRLRKTGRKARFFMCGEYGELNLRPHFHALLFGVTFGQRELCGKDIYRSPELEKLWPYGYSSFGSVTYESAGYVARYNLKKVVGAAASRHYTRVDRRTGEYIVVEPEFAHMSLKPGIGFEWFRKYWRECSSVRDGVVLRGGRVVPLPRFYDRLLAEANPDLAEWRDFTRYVNSIQFQDDCTPERLAVREHCAVARLSNNARKL